MFEKINLLKKNRQTAWVSLVAILSLSGCVTPPKPVEEKPVISGSRSEPAKVPSVVKQKPATHSTKHTANETPAIKEKASRIKTAQGKIILGELEWANIIDAEVIGKARIDTGATTSSLYAKDIVTFERNGEDWVKFKLVYKDVTSKTMTYPVQRWLKVRQSINKSVAINRPVIELWIQLGDLKTKTLFNLADRSHMKYDILLGRSLFRDIAVVDVSRKYVQAKPE